MAAILKLMITLFGNFYTIWLVVRYVHLWAESYILRVDDNKQNGKYLCIQIQIVDKQSEIL